MLRYLILVCIFLTAFGCSSKKESSSTYEKYNDSISKKIKAPVVSNIREIKDIPQFDETADLVAPGFLFALRHPTDTKLQGTFRVQFDGILRLPYGVVMQVKGLTYEQLRKKVHDAYTTFFQRGAQDVSFVLVSKEYWVEVRGFVKKSGTFLVKRKESIDKIIDTAGGLAGNIKQDFFVVSIKQQDISYSVSLNQYYENNAIGTSFTWTGGDVIFINLSNEDSATQIAPTVEVFGGVASPGKSLYKEDASLFYYLSKRGGVNPNISYSESYIVRNGANGLENINFNLTEMDTIPVIRPGDTIMLYAAKQTTWDKIMLRATQFGSLLATIAVLILAL